MESVLDSLNMTDASLLTYANANYWDDYYNSTGKEESYDWYSLSTLDVSIIEHSTFFGGEKGRSYRTLRDFFEIRAGMTPDKKILMLGCGNSQLSPHME